MADDPNKDQAEYWGAAQKWIDYQAALDATLGPVLDRLLEVVQLQPGEAVLDIGCGTGASTMAVTKAIGPDGRVLGADISELLLGQAKVRMHGVTNAGFLRADAQTSNFGRGGFGGGFGGGFDCAMSRFGVMFFADPVAAFANIRKALKPGGRLVFLAWDGLDANPWFRLPGQIAMARLGPMPKPDPRAPGPMAFADRDYVSGILQGAGWDNVSVRETEVFLTPPGGVAGAAAISSRVGMAARVIAEKGGTDEDARIIEAEVAKEWTKHDTPDGVRVPAALNLCTARA